MGRHEEGLVIVPGPAAGAGLQGSDVLRKVAGIAITDVVSYLGEIHAPHAGETLVQPARAE